MLTVKNLTKIFKSGEHEVKAVDNISLSVDGGVFGAIIGKSGSGKSTLLSLLGALDKPTSGMIDVDGKTITKLSDRRLISYRCQKIGLVFQNYNLIPNLTALENVMLPMEFAGIRRAERKKRAAKLLKMVGLDIGKQERNPGRLSGGEQQRVAIARAIANKPKLILADEPTGNLDSATGKIIIDLLKNLAKKENTTIITVTHDTGVARQAEIIFHLKDSKLTRTTLE